jgi:hypothetical protein
VLVCARLEAVGARRSDLPFSPLDLVQPDDCSGTGKNIPGVNE